MIKRSRSTSTLQLLYQPCMKMATPATRKRRLLTKFQQTVPVPLNWQYQIGPCPYKPCFTVTVRQLLNYMSNTINYNNRYTIYTTQQCILFAPAATNLSTRSKMKMLRIWKFQFLYNGINVLNLRTM